MFGKKVPKEPTRGGALNVVYPTKAEIEAYYPDPKAPSPGYPSRRCASVERSVDYFGMITRQKHPCHSPKGPAPSTSLPGYPPLRRCRGVLQSAADLFIFMLAGGKHTLIPNLPPVSCVHHLTLREADSLPYRRYSGSLVGAATCRPPRISRHESPAIVPAFPYIPKPAY